jgi:Flp pilus assembly pilin Flp
VRPSVVRGFQKMSRSAHGAPEGPPVRSAAMTSESGQTSIEYALILSLVALVLVAALVAINGPFASFVSDLASSIAGLV